jgi:hypothetical protein
VNLKLKEGWVAVENDTLVVRFWGKTTNPTKFTVAEWHDKRILVDPMATGEALWICDTIKMAHKSLVDNGFESPWEEAC